MKSMYETARSRMYPHLVTRGTRRPTFWNITVSNVPLDEDKPQGPHVLVGPRMLDVTGNLTDRGRSAVAEYAAARAKRDGRDLCVVWGEHDCTWYDQDGTAIPGATPPQAFETLNPYMYDQLPISTEACWVYKLPEGCEPSHLCVLRIDETRIEIAPGETSILGEFDERPVVGERDPASEMLDAEGHLRPPSTYRGQPVIEVEDEHTLIGPVQPSQDGLILRTPWPRHIREACNTIAGCYIDERIVASIFGLAHVAVEDLPPAGVVDIT